MMTMCIYKLMMIMFIFKMMLMTMFIFKLMMTMFIFKLTMMTMCMQESQWEV